MSDDLAWSAAFNTVREVPKTPTGIRSGRTPDGDVVLGFPHGDLEEVLLIPEHEWVGIVAAVTKDGASETAVRSASMVHASQAKIDIAISGQVIAQVVLQIADAIILPKPKPIVIPDNPRGVIGQNGGGG